MSSVRMGVAGALPGSPEDELGLLKHQHPMLGKEEIPGSVEHLLWARHDPCPYWRLAPFPCFFSARSSGKLCYCDLSLLARPGGLWIPNCWLGTLLHIETLRTPSASSSVSSL